MSRFISPPRDQLDKLRQPLTDGEKQVFEFFDTHLDEKWEIYIQPHLNGLRPDFVLLNETVGIAVFEVKDWDLDAMEYWIETYGNRGKAPILMARKNGQKFSLQNHNPVEQLYRYREEIIDLYCPRLARRAGRESLAVITAGIIFPNADCERVNELLAPCLTHRNLRHEKYNPVSGQDTLKSEALKAVFPSSTWKTSKYMKPDLAKDLRHWLVEPDFAATQREPLELDANQRRYATERTQSGYRRIKGPAGSGKSQVLAARAAQLAYEGKEVLVVTYNITLMHYLRDLAVRYQPPLHRLGSLRNITWLNFHSWCKRLCQEHNYEKEYNQLWKEYKQLRKEFFHDGNNALDHLLHHQLPALASSIVDNNIPNLKYYDAVLVDEGQDFRPNWWNVLRKVCKEKAEKLLVADKTQDIYGTARAWTDKAMIGAGFSGNWNTLKVSYRLPPQLIDHAQSFAEQFLPNDLVDLPISPQLELEVYPCQLRWVQTNEERAVECCVQEILKMPPLANRDILAIPDITFLVDRKDIGLEVITTLGKKGIKCLHTFDPDSWENRSQKLGFYMGDARVKATTLHSFKGWETRALVVYTGHTFNDRNKVLTYIGMTRLKRHQKQSLLTIVSAIPEFAEYGKTWPEFSVM